MKSTQSFKSIEHLKREYRLILPKPYHWWLVDKPRVGQINAINQFRGVEVATNGPLCLIINEVGTTFIGHRDWFVEDPTQAEKAIQGQRKQTSSTPSPNILEYV